MTKRPVTVVVDTYNQEKYIEQAVVSAIEQDFPASEYEIVVVDDGSTDRTPDIVRKFAPRVRLLSKRNGGQASAFNAAFPELRGEIIGFLDGDDWWAREKLSTVAAALAERPEASAVGHGYYEVDEREGEIKVQSPGKRLLLSLASPDAAREAVLWSRFLVLSALTVRRSVLRVALPLPNSLWFCADAPIIWAAMGMGAFVLDRPLSYYRRHAENLWAVDNRDNAAMRRRAEMDAIALDEIEPVLVRLGVPTESMAATLYPMQVYQWRAMLGTFGGSRFRAFRTEMRDFRSKRKKTALSYRLLEHAAVGAAALLLPPRAFYRMRGDSTWGRVQWAFRNYLWHPVLNATRGVRHPLGLKRRGLKG